MNGQAGITGVKLDKELLIPVVIFVAVLLFAFLVFFVSKNIARKKASTNEPLVDDVKKLIVKADVTLSQAAIGSAADKLYIAMRGMGTDERAIYQVMNIVQTNSDLYSIIVAFGKRKSGDFYDNLSAWIADECSAGEIETINNILSKKGINFKF